MYEEEKFGWRTYKWRLIAIGFIWVFAFVIRNRWGPPDIGAGWILAVIVSLFIFVAGAWDSELRYETPSHIVAENGLHFSFHPFARHTTGAYTIIAVGGISAGGIEWKSGEGTLVFPTALLHKPATNPSKILHIRGAPCKCLKDNLPAAVRRYISKSGFGELKGPFYFTMSPLYPHDGYDSKSLIEVVKNSTILEDDKKKLAAILQEDQKFKEDVIKLTNDEDTIMDLHRQIAERDKMIRGLIEIRSELKDFNAPWFKRLFGGEKKQDEGA